MGEFGRRNVVAVLSFRIRSLGVNPRFCNGIAKKQINKQYLAIFGLVTG